MLIGHEVIISDLKRLVERGKLGHGYLFFGPPRVGKCTAALGFARFLERGVFDDANSPPPNLPHQGGGSSGKKDIILMDATVIEPKPDPETGLPGDSIGIDQVREITNFLSRFPNRSLRRTVVINNAEALTREAQNALLKIAEEPPKAGLLILIVQDPERLLPTVQSRFQKLYFGPVAAKEIAVWLTKAHAVSAADAKKAAAECGGLPGLAHAIIFDEQFKKVHAAAERFLYAAPGARAALVKDMVAEDDFAFAPLLDALTLVLCHPGESRDPGSIESGFRVKPGMTNILHAVFELRRNADYFNLNPRLQLTALSQLL